MSMLSNISCTSTVIVCSVVDNVVFSLKMQADPVQVQHQPVSVEDIEKVKKSLKVKEIRFGKIESELVPAGAHFAPSMNVRKWVVQGNGDQCAQLQVLKEWEAAGKTGNTTPKTHDRLKYGDEVWEINRGFFRTPHYWSLKKQEHEKKEVIIERIIALQKKCVQKKLNLPHDTEEDLRELTLIDLNDKLDLVTVPDIVDDKALIRWFAKQEGVVDFEKEYERHFDILEHLGLKAFERAVIVQKLLKLKFHEDCVNRIKDRKCLENMLAFKEYINSREHDSVEYDQIREKAMMFMLKKSFSDQLHSAECKKNDVVDQDDQEYLENNYGTVDVEAVIQVLRQLIFDEERIGGLSRMKKMKKMRTMRTLRLGDCAVKQMIKEYLVEKFHVCVLELKDKTGKDKTLDELQRMEHEWEEREQSPLTDFEIKFRKTYRENGLREAKRSLANIDQGVRDQCTEWIVRQLISNLNLEGASIALKTWRNDADQKKLPLIKIFQAEVQNLKCLQLFIDKEMEYLNDYAFRGVADAFICFKRTTDQDVNRAQFHKVWLHSMWERVKKVKDFSLPKIVKDAGNSGGFRKGLKSLVAELRKSSEHSQIHASFPLAYNANDDHFDVCHLLENLREDYGEICGENDCFERQITPLFQRMLTFQRKG